MDIQFLPTFLSDCGAASSQLKRRFKGMSLVLLTVFPTAPISVQVTGAVCAPRPRADYGFDAAEKCDHSVPYQNMD
jgi:hypothetical protein